MSALAPWWASLPQTSFGFADMEERLAALILAGRKRATVWNGQEGNPTAPGRKWVVTVKNKPVAVIETISVERLRFDQIDAAFAFEEGEGDLSLEYWRAGHEAFFRPDGFFAPDMDLWCERFRLIEIIDHDLAAAAAAHVALEQAEGEAKLSGMPPEP